MKDQLSQGLMHDWFPAQGATNNDILATYLHYMVLAEYISLKKTTEGSQKFSLCIRLTSLILEQ